MNKQELLNRISTFLGRFTQEVKQYNNARQYDINIHAENVLIPLLKEVFDYQGLQNANAVIKNAPAIDLIDYESRVSIQVTATADAQKITETLEKFTKNEQQRAFDRVIIYIITERQKTYRKDFNTLLPSGFDFNTERDVIDNSSLYNFISNNVLNARKLALIEKILSEEFSELKIQKRSVKNSYDLQVENKNKKDNIYPNLIELVLPKNMYQADVDFDFDEWRPKLIKYLKSNRQFKKIKHISGRDIINFFLRTYDANYVYDFILRSKKLLTFRNLHLSNELLRNVIDLGTITPLTCEEYIDNDEDRENTMKDLINSTMRQDFYSRGIEWVGEEELYRFQIGKSLNARKVSYKSKAGRKVVFEVLSKEGSTKVTDENGNERVLKGKHIICFRHLAFSVSYNLFGDTWYMSIKPSWSYTSALDGKRPSRYASTYLSGIKQLEWNDTLFDQLQFLSEHIVSISEGDIFSGFVIKVTRLKVSHEVSPSIPDEVWSQSEPQSKKVKGQYELFGK